MGKYIIVITDIAKKDFEKHKKVGNASLLKKVDKIISELKEHPFIGVGKPEPLKHNLQGLWSRRINNKDRIIYKVVDDVVTIYVLSAIGHYDDK